VMLTVIEKAKGETRLSCQRQRTRHLVCRGLGAA
jgi:hypothetical protein